MAVRGKGILTVIIHCSGEGVTGVSLERGRAKPSGDDPFGGAAFIEAYLEGVSAPMPRLDLSLTGFQERVYARLLEVPYGEVVTYGELARRVGTAPRAIGQAMASNPVPIIYPCHRVVAHDGPGGFGKDVGLKEFLLEHERALRRR